jgi:ribosome-associated protein
MAEQRDDWVILAARAAASKQAIEPVILEVGVVLAITDHFLVTSAPNTRLVRTIAEEIEKQVVEAGGPRPARTEGLDDLRWVLLDYGDFVVHVFLDETRAYYELERLWADVPRVAWVEPAAARG